MLANTFVSKCNARQVVARKRRQVSVERLLRQKKTVASLCPHCSLPTKRPVKPFEGDGSYGGAGDGTRTRDSLLGRQIVAKSPLACVRLALEERLLILYVIHAHLGQMVKGFSRQIVMDRYLEKV
jgi:hypothetical protein